MMVKKVNMGGEITVSIDGARPVPCELQMETEPIDVTTMGRSEPDMDWEFVDERGHFHAFDSDGKLPTLVPREVWVEYEEPDEDGETGYSYTVWDCGICGVEGAEVRPEWKYIPTIGREYAPGRTTWLLRTDDPVPNERFSVLVTYGETQVFGFGDGTTAQYQDRRFVTFCGPMARRKKAAA